MSTNEQKLQFYADPSVKMAVNIIKNKQPLPLQSTQIVGKRNGLQMKLNEHILIGQPGFKLQFDINQLHTRNIVTAERTTPRASNYQNSMFSEGKTPVSGTIDGFLRIADGISRVKGRRKTELPSLWKNQSISYGTESRLPATPGTGIARHILILKGQQLNNTEGKIGTETPNSLRSQTVHPKQRAQRQHLNMITERLPPNENNTSIWKPRMSTQRGSPVIMKLGLRGQTSDRNRVRKLSFNKLDDGNVTTKTANQKLNSNQWCSFAKPTQQEVNGNDITFQERNERLINFQSADQTSVSLENQSVSTVDQQRRRKTQEYNLDSIRNKVQNKMLNNSNLRAFKLNQNQNQNNKDPLARYIERQHQNAVKDKNSISKKLEDQEEYQDESSKNKLSYEQRVEIRDLMQQIDKSIKQKKTSQDERYDPSFLLECLDRKVQEDRWKHMQTDENKLLIERQRIREMIEEITKQDQVAEETKSFLEMILNDFSVNKIKESCIKDIKQNLLNHMYKKIGTFNNKNTKEETQSVLEIVQQKQKLTFFQLGIKMQYSQKIGEMKKAFEEIFGQINLGTRYKETDVNLWGNQEKAVTYAFSNADELMSGLLKKIPVAQQAAPESFQKLEQLYNHDVKTTSFYQLAKTSRIVKADGEDEVEHKRNQKQESFNKISMDYYITIQNHYEVPLPTFAKLTDNELFLSEFRISDAQAIALRNYLDQTQDMPANIVKAIHIDDCGMTDFQFSQILIGVAAQGQYLKSLVYSSGQLGEESTLALIQLIPFIQDLSLNNITGARQKQMFQKILKALLDEGEIKKLKLSNLYLNDGLCMQLIFALIKKPQTELFSLDLSWAKLSPQHLKELSIVLLEFPDVLRFLNLSYNSVCFHENTHNKFYDSIEFLNSFTQYLQATRSLVHLDLSGLSFNDEHLLELSHIITKMPTLLAIHLSDVGICHSNDLMLHILECFGISDKYADRKPETNFRNKLTQNGNAIKQLIRKTYNINDKQEEIIENQFENLQDYQNHVTMTKQTKAIQINKIKNSVQVSGIGRIGNSPGDEFVLTRKLMHPELMYNNCPYKDAYWQVGAEERWQLSFKYKTSNSCYVCQKHKFTMIFLDEVENNGDLIEIKDPKTINEVKQQLNLEDHEDNETPIICGSVVKSGFERKLKMLKTNLFGMLACSESHLMFSSLKDQSTIKKGIHIMAKKNQNQPQYEIIDKLHGWQYPLRHMVTSNIRDDVQLINIPSILAHNRPLTPLDTKCTSWVYAAYLPPGNHQFLIYQNGATPRLFVKNILINLSSVDLKVDAQKEDIVKAEKRVHTIGNVWRKFKNDTLERDEIAYKFDLKNYYEPSLFIKDKEEEKQCTQYLKDNFEIVKIVYLELLSLNNEKIEKAEIVSESMETAFMPLQDEIESELLRKQDLELCYIKATRGDKGYNRNLAGSLCRGEFMEFLLRMSRMHHGESNLIETLPIIFKTYLEPIYIRSTIKPLRQIIQNTKRINRLLYENMQGLKIIFNESLINKKYTYESAQKQFDPIDGLKIPLKNLFYFAQMTNLKDHEREHKYHALQFVEWLEFICRVALIDEIKSENNGLLQESELVKKTEEQISKDKEVAVCKIHELLEKLWVQRQKVFPPDACDKKVVIAGKIQRARRVTQLCQLEKPGDQSSDGYDSCDH